MKTLNNVLMLAGMTLMLMLPTSAKAEAPPECPCPMQDVTMALADILSSSSPESSSECSIDVDINEPSFLANASFRISVGEASASQSVSHEIQFEKKVEGIQRSYSGQCETSIDDVPSPIGIIIYEETYQACRSEWFNLANLYNAAMPENSCSRDALNSFRRGEEVTFP